MWTAEPASRGRVHGTTLAVGSLVAAVRTEARARALETKSIGLIELWRDSRRRRFERDVLEGLSRAEKSIPARYLLDERGVEFSRALAEAPENYLNRAEREILLRYARAFTGPLLAGKTDIVDLAPGDALKTRILLERFRDHDARYVPIASSEALLHETVQSGARTLPWLPMFPVRAEAYAGLSHLAALDPSRVRLVLWLGSQIGQLDRAAMLTYVRGLRDALRPNDHVLVSFDLMKEPALLEAAHDDAAGLNARYHLNVLSRINRELNAQFNPSDFRYRAEFQSDAQAVSCQLVSRRVQSVRVGHFRHELDALEPIQTERACKFRQSEIHELARRAGFVDCGTFSDERSHVQIARWSVPV